MRYWSLYLIRRQNFYLFFLLCLTFFSGCCLRPDSTSPGDQFDSRQKESIRFIVAADPQLFRGDKSDLVEAIQLINRLEPDFVVMCGDLVETPSNMEQIRAYKDAVTELSGDIPLYNLPGNHDLGRPVGSNNISTYQQHFGELWFDFEYGDGLFIGLCSDILADADAPMHGEHKKWLWDILDSPEAKKAENIFVFMHHPLYLNSPDEPGAYSNMPVGIRKELLEFFVQNGVQAVFSGHFHDNRINSYQGVDLITTNSITAPLGKIPAGFRVVEVRQERYEQTYYTTEELKKEIETLR
ncbi:Calcineurin-like phosphoesterase [Anaerohalosphaera lusitana]|uniref:Calcineurin-like phosphoesterase n=1 Tax=Anaerohalosphaera lusitana TaxID=1936003 RepID=A0A1U9NPQ1_9BACT|nr:metallophosphoesterase [Anaerohalosphaera lusitana]AQT69815.1 Calcineurin-like phosphoesterase [Anaerohalosphaera lusitana]